MSACWLVGWLVSHGITCAAQRLFQIMLVYFTFQVLDANYNLEKMKETYDSMRQDILFGCR